MICNLYPIVCFVARSRLLIGCAVLTLLCPPPARAQGREAFTRALVDFANAVTGTYGDEGAAMLAALDAMDVALAQWDAAIARVEAGLASEIGTASPPIAARMRAALGTVYLDQGRAEPALTQFAAAATLDPQFAEVHRLRGLVLDALNRTAEARAAYRLAWQRDPGNPA